MMSPCGGKCLVTIPHHVTVMQVLARLAHATLAPRAGRRMRLGVLDGAAGDLHPARLRIEFLRVAAAEDFKRAMGMALEIDDGLALPVREPIRRDEIGD